MRKNRLVIALSLLLTAACIFTACGNSGDDTENDEMSTATESTITDDEAGESSETDSSYYEDTVYGTLLNDYNDLINATLQAAADPDGDSYVEDENNLLGATGVQEFIYSNPDDAKSWLGYLVEDVSGDGVPELLIGYAMGDANEGTGDSMIFALYTCVDEQPYGVFDGWYRNKYFYKGDNLFGYYGSSSAASSGFGTFCLTEDGTEMAWNDFYFSDLDQADNETIVYFHNTTGDWDQDASEKMDISDKEFWNLDEQIEAEQEMLPFVPFSHFIPSAGENADDSGCPMHAESAASLEDYQEHDECSDGNNPQTQIMLIVDEPVYDVEVFSVSDLVYDDYGPEYESDLLYNAEEMNPERPLLLKVNIRGDSPEYGVSYKMSDGIYHTFFIEQSGMDNSFVLTEVSAG